MSEENVEIVRRSLESFEPNVEAWLETLDPDVKWYVREERHALVVGHEAALRARERWRETYDPESYRFEIEELKGEGENVFAVVGVWGEGSLSGIPFETAYYVHAKVRGDKVVYMYEHDTRDEAFEAAGLRE